MTELALARALHVLGVVVWIGGVCMVSTVVLPALRRGRLGSDRLSAFQAIERRFVWQARAAVLLVGATGLYLTARMELWDRFRNLAFWWMHAMAAVWLLFFIILFVGEPLVLHRWFSGWAAREPERALAWLHAAHLVVLALSLATVVGAAAGAHGGF